MPGRAPEIPLDAYFEGADPRSRPLFDAVSARIVAIGPAEVRATKSQVAFRRRVPFAWTWRPGRYLRGEVAALAPARTA